jgi:hypothetical protein
VHTFLRLLENAVGYGVMFAFMQWIQRISGAGPLGPRGYRAAQAFKTIAWGGLGLAAADVAVFAAKPDLMWRDLCMCDLSIGLILLGIALLIPGRMLNFRLGTLPIYEDSPSARAFRLRVTLWSAFGAAVVIATAVLYGSIIKGEAPDWVVWIALTAPLFPLFIWSAMTGTAAVRELRPPEQGTAAGSSPSDARPASHPVSLPDASQSPA